MGMKHFLFIIVACFLLLITPFLAMGEDDGLDLNTSDSEDRMAVLTEGRIPNYLVSIGVRGGYMQPVGMIADYVQGAFTPSLYVRYNPGLLDGLVFQFDSAFWPTELDINRADDGSRMDTLGLAFGPRYGYYLLDFLSLNVYTNAGLMLHWTDDRGNNDKESYVNFLFQAGLEVEFELAYHSDLAIGFNFQTPFEDTGLQGFNFYLSYGFRIGGEPRENQLKISNPMVSSVFPSQSNLYAQKQSIGTVTLTNTGEDPVENIQIAMYLEGFMDNPSISPGTHTLTEKESLIVPFYSTFNNQIMELTNDRIVSSEIIIRYEIDGTTYTKRETVSMNVYNRNAVVWEPVNRVCSFVSSDDPVIRLLRSSLETEFNENQDASFVNNNLRKAMKAFAALKSLNLEYLSDPTKPFTTSSESGNAVAVDTIQYPAELLDQDNRTGDCDDYAVLYASLLQSVGVPAGFIVTPQHIFAMFNTGIPAESVGMVTEDPNKVIIHQNMVWIPVETTFLDKDYGDFIDAWDKGIEEYHVNASNLQLVSVEQSWQDYPPVAIGYDVDQFTRPNYNNANSLYNDTIVAYRTEHRSRVNQAMDSVRVANLSPDQKRDTALDFIRANNPERAIDLLQAIAGDGSKDFEDYYYLATAMFQEGSDLQGAIDNFMKSKQYLSQDDSARYLPRVYINIAQCYYRLGNPAEQQRYYNMAQNLNPALAHRFAFLGPQMMQSEGQAMASDVTQQNVPLLLDN